MAAASAVDGFAVPSTGVMLSTIAYLLRKYRGRARKALRYPFGKIESNAGQCKHVLIDACGGLLNERDRGACRIHLGEIAGTHDALSIGTFCSRDRFALGHPRSDVD